MTTLDHSLLPDRVSAAARDIHLGRALLTLLAAVLYATGWLASKALLWAWVAATWCAAAVRVGWAEAREPGGS